MPRESPEAERESTPVLSDVLEQQAREKRERRLAKRTLAADKKRLRLKAREAAIKHAKAAKRYRKRAQGARRARAQQERAERRPEKSAAAVSVQRSPDGPSEPQLDLGGAVAEMSQPDEAPTVHRHTFVSAAANGPGKARRPIEWPGLPGEPRDTEMADADPEDADGEHTQNKDAENEMENPQAENADAASNGQQRSMRMEIVALKVELEQLRAFVKGPEAAARAPNTSGAAAPNPVRVTPKDVQLENFAGNRDANAHVIAADQFLPLLEWIQACEFTLVTSRLPAELHVPVLVSHLTGAAKRAFLRRWGTTASAVVREWTLDDAKLAIASLVPNHKLLFTKTAMDMQFTAGTLENDLQRFSLYMRNGDVAVDNSQYVFDALQSKMQSAVHDVFTLAANLYNKTLQFKPTFAAIMQDAIDIVSTLQVNGKLTPPKRGRNDAQEQPSANRKRARVQRSANGGRQGGDSSKKRIFLELARKYNRCYGCGRYVPPGEVKEHKAQCKRDPGAFAKRMGQVKRLDDMGKGAEVNVFPPAAGVKAKKAEHTTKKADNA